ncbi:MAG: hypothetical protein Kow0029_23020 [Candidatus Rifleibacteriota bacterium]
MIRKNLFVLSARNGLLIPFILILHLFTPGVILADNRALENDLYFFSEQLEQQPQNPDLNYNMAQIYFLMGNIDEAIRFLERTLFLSPDDVEASIKLSSIYRKIGRLWDSRHILENAAKLQQNNPDIWYELGVVLSDLAAYPESLEAFKKALQYSRNEEQKNLVLYYLGIQYLTSRDYDHFQSCLQRLPESSQYYKELKKLGQFWIKE